MLLHTIFEQLSHGELAQLAIGNKDGAGIVPESYPAITAHLNLALTALYKIFPLRMEEAIIQQNQATNLYFLSKQFAVNGGSDEPVKYLIDTVNKPFIDNVLKIERIVNEEGEEIPLNDINDDNSIFTPSFNSIQIPDPIDTVTVGVIYRADHTEINPINLDPKTLDVPIPNSLLEPLLFYIASRAYASVPMVDGINQSAGYLNKFEASIQRIKNLDLVNDDEKPNQKLWNNGWV